MKLQEYLDKDLLLKMIDLGYVNVNKHPDADLYILNYSKTCPIDQMWNDVTEKCRGLIVDSSGEIKARPFRKFYNYEEIEDKSIIPNLPFEVYEKMDGSLGILYWIDGIPYIATKGSFISDQAQIGTAILHAHGYDLFKELDKNITYLFEIITPQDAKIVNYGETEDLFLITGINIETGEEIDIYQYNHLFRTVNMYNNVKSWKNLRETIDGTNREGFVIKFSNNFRVKLKYAEYFELHHILYGLSDNAVFDLVREGKDDDLSILKDKLPEAQWLRIDNLIQTFKCRYYEIAIRSRTEFRKDFESRKEAAEYFKTCSYPSIMFAMLDGRDISQFIWKIIAKERKDDR